MNLLLNIVIIKVLKYGNKCISANLQVAAFNLCLFVRNVFLLIRALIYRRKYYSDLRIPIFVVDKYQNIVFNSRSVIEYVISCIIQGENTQTKMNVRLKLFWEYANDLHSGPGMRKE